MDITTTALVITIVLLIAGFIVYLSYQQNKKDKEDQENQNNDHSIRTLRFQAYERLTVLVDRIALPNLISRVNQNGIGARDMQLLLTRSIKEEFDYNISQQIYVSVDAWDAVKNLKNKICLL